MNAGPEERERAEPRPVERLVDGLEALGKGLGYNRRGWRAHRKFSRG